MRRIAIKSKGEGTATQTAYVRNGQSPQPVDATEFAMNGLSRDAPMAELVVPIALEIVTGGGMEEIGPALVTPGVDEAGSAGAQTPTS